MGYYDNENVYKPISTVLRENRIINLVGPVNNEMAYQVTSALHVLNNEDKKTPIQLFINSPGGSCVDGLAIIDTMNFIEAPVYVICTGLAASMGAAILSAGEPGHRYALPNSEIMVHQASSGAEGNIQDMRVSLKQTERVNERLARMLAENCGMTYEEYLDLTVRDYYMWPEEALPGKFGSKGIIDEIITSEKLKERLSK